MTSPFLQKINYIKNEFFMIFWKKYVPSDEIKLRDEITGFDGTYYSIPYLGRYLKGQSNEIFLLPFFSLNGLSWSQ
jgi:hypothetical protein